jgi:hypothetical protein
MARRAVRTADILDGHVSVAIECLDRIYLNGYVPNLQVGGQVVQFLAASGFAIPSPVVVGRIGDRFRRAVRSYADANQIPMIKFGKGAGRAAHQHASPTSRFGAPSAPAVTPRSSGPAAHWPCRHAAFAPWPSTVRPKTSQAPVGELDRSRPRVPGASTQYRLTGQPVLANVPIEADLNWNLARCHSAVVSFTFTSRCPWPRVEDAMFASRAGTEPDAHNIRPRVSRRPRRGRLPQTGRVDAARAAPLVCLAAVG